MATKWKSFSRSGAFKAVLAAAYIACTAAAGAVTGFGEAFCYDDIMDDGMALIFDTQDRYNKQYCSDKLVTAVLDCDNAYEDEKVYTIDYQKIVDSFRLGISITDENGVVYSNGLKDTVVEYKVTASGERINGAGIKTISLGDFDYANYYDEGWDLTFPVDGFVRIEYDRLAEYIPFAVNIGSESVTYSNNFDEDDGDGIIKLTLKPVKAADGLIKEEVYLTLWKSGMGAFMTADELDTSVYQTALNDLDFYCRITTKDGAVYENSVPYGVKVSYNCSDDSLLAGIAHGNTKYITDVEIGLTENQSAALMTKYNNGVHDMRIIIITDICLFVLSTAILIYFCCIIGVTPEGEKKLSPALSVFYEITAAALLTAAVSGIINFMSGYYGTFSKMDSYAGGVCSMILTAVIAAGTSLLWLYLWLCLAARSKNGVLKEGSLIYRLVKFLWKIIRAVCSFLKDLFLGRMIRSSAAKRLLWTDIVFLVITALNIILFFWAAMAHIPVIAMFFLVLEVVFVGLFVYARFSLIRDVSRLQQQIEDVYLGKSVSSAEFSEKSLFRESGERLEKLGEQYRRGMEERVKAERMKIDLVTNVSHDLKTPLTSIISYIDLLSREELPQTAADYVKILQNKSERLKNIVSDVFELAKATSGEITADSAELDLTKLSYQALADMEDKIAASGFEVKRSICEPPVLVMSDGKRIYRIIQNLLDNALKYSMEGTRIYYTLEKRDGAAVITIKNISAVPIELTAEEITERFVRGDKSRSSEGSGLGLSIAQGFALACGGELKIEIDGDMFKAEVRFPLYFGEIK